MQKTQKVQKVTNTNMLVKQYPASNKGKPTSEENMSREMRRMETEGWSAEKEVCALILTVNTGSSYDPLFSSVRQQPPTDDLAISLFSLNFGMLLYLLAVLRDGRSQEGLTLNPDAAAALKQFQTDYERAEPHSVLLNFECCSGCSDTGFPVDGAKVMDAVRLFVERGHTVMFADFSLKALIGQWRGGASEGDALLGRNPFCSVGTLNSNFRIEFSPTQLRTCAVPQLQTVGNLCDSGLAEVHAMGSTLRFDVSSSYRPGSEPYELTVLTVVTAWDGNSDSRAGISFIENDRSQRRVGTVGHVLLDYGASKGKIIASCGHWIELSNLNASVDSLVRQAAVNYGSEYSERLRKEVNQIQSESDRRQYIQKQSNMYVQQAAPVAYGNMMKSKSAHYTKKN